jgi:hypothetical protein
MKMSLALLTSLVICLAVLVNAFPSSIAALVDTAASNKIVSRADDDPSLTWHGYSTAQICIDTSMVTVGNVVGSDLSRATEAALDQGCPSGAEKGACHNDGTFCFGKHPFD